jgi:3-phosphoshikimate 1-carboxyvinyltransferase
VPGIVSQSGEQGLSAAAWTLAPAAAPLRIEFQPAGDEYIAQLALVLGALCQAPLQISGLPHNSVIERTMRLLAQLGAEITGGEDDLLSISTPMGKLRSPDLPLDCGESANLFFLLCGLIAGRKLSAELTCTALQASAAAAELLAPLAEMGAELSYPLGLGRLPVRIRGCPLRPLQLRARWEITAHKAMLLIAGLGTVGKCQVFEQQAGPDHSERLLRFLGVDVLRSGNMIQLTGEMPLRGGKLRVPGDFALVAPLLVAATLIPGSEVSIPMVGANPLRCAIVRKLARIGARIERPRDWQFGTEPVAAIKLSAPKKIGPFNVPPNLAWSMLDEVPLLALIATQASGSSHMRGLDGLARRIPNELLLSVLTLREFGADVESEAAGLTINGPHQLFGAKVQCGGCRRTALLAAVAALTASGPSELYATGGLNESAPELVALLESLGS